MPHGMVVSSVGGSLEKMVSYQQESKGRIFINNPPWALKLVTNQTLSWY